MSSKNRLVSDCLRFCQIHKITPRQLGKKAIDDYRMFERLEGDGDITTRKMDRLYAFMNKYSPQIINPMLGENHG